MAEELGFRPRVCRPYRAQTKGKVERFNGYLKRSFVTPLAAPLKQAGLMLGVTAANAHIGPWLQEVANQRRHGTTDEIPAIRLQQELPLFLPLPHATHDVSVPLSDRPVPTAGSQWSALAQRAANDEASFADYLEWLLQAEQTTRTERTRQTLP